MDASRSRVIVPPSGSLHVEPAICSYTLVRSPLAASTPGGASAAPTGTANSQESAMKHPVMVARKGRGDMHVPLVGCVQILVTPPGPAHAESGRPDPRFRP